MTRKTLAWIAAVVVVIAAVVGIAWGSALSAPASGTLALAGDVRAQSVTVNAPAIVYPAIDTSVGIATTATAGPPARSSAGMSVSMSRLPVVSGRLAAVYVGLGSRVTTGQPLVQLDTAMLDLGVEQAEANATRARTQVDVLDSLLDTLGGSAQTVATARAKLLATGSTLTAALSQAEAGRVKLLSAIAALEQVISHLPTSTPMPPTSTVPPGRRSPNPVVVLAQLKAQLAQLDAAIVKLRSGLALLASGKAQLASASSQLDTARSQLETARDVANIMVGAQELGVSVAEVERDQARILSPVSGVVTYVLAAGSTAMVGTPLDAITPDRPVLVDTYVADNQIAGVSVGERADVSYDSAPGAVLHGRVTIIAASSTFPPTSFPTNLIHLTRALEVTITLDRGPAPPPGTPVDLVIHTHG